MVSIIVPRDSLTDFQLYRYTPSIVGAAIVAGLFAISCVVHTTKLLRLKARYFIPFTIGLAFELVGYIGRAWSHYNKTALAPYIMQAILILVAPALFAASIYMVLGRITTLLGGEEYSVIPIRWLTKIFVLGDVLSFLIQAGGGGIQAGGTLQMLKLGERLIVVGLFLQIFMFGFFVIASVTFHVRYNRHGMPRPAIPWEKHFKVIYITSTIILVRSIFRVIEYLQGNDGWILRHEYMLYLFDAALMLSLPVIFYITHPAELFQQKGEAFLPMTSIDTQRNESEDAK